MNVRSNKELLNVILNNQELFKTTLYKWLIDLHKNRKITFTESVFIYSNIGGIKLRYSDMLNIGLIEQRLKWLKDKLK